MYSIDSQYTYYTYSRDTHIKSYEHMYFHTKKLVKCIHIYYVPTLYITKNFRF